MPTVPGDDYFSDVRGEEQVLAPPPNPNDISMEEEQPAPSTSQAGDYFDDVREADTSLPVTIEAAKTLDPSQSRRNIEANRSFSLPDSAGGAMTQQHEFDTKWQDMVRASATPYPELNKVLAGNPDLTAAVRDDFRRYQTIHEAMDEMPAWMRVGSSFVSGLNSFGAGISGFGEYVGRKAFETVGLTNPLTDLDESITDYFKKQAEFFSTNVGQIGIQKVAESADPGLWLSWFVEGAAQSIPAMAPAMVAGPVGLIPMAASQMGNKLEETENLDIPEWKRFTNAAVNGAAEAVFELGPLKGQAKVLKIMEDSIGKIGAQKVLQSAKNILQKELPEVFKLVATEAASEMGTQLTQDTSDVLFDTDPDALKGEGWKLLGAGLQGGFMAGAVRAPYSATSAINRAIEKRRVEKQKMTYDLITGKEANTAMKAEAPTVEKGLLQSMFERGKIDRMTIPKSVFIDILTQKGMDPSQVAEELGARTAFDQAPETGSINVKTSEWVSKFGGTDTATQFRDNFSFEAEKPTSAESKEIEPPKPEEIIKDDIEAQVKAAGIPQAAEAVGAIRAAQLKVREAIMKIPMMQLASEAGVTIARKTGIKLATSLNGQMFQPDPSLDPEGQKTESAMAKEVAAPEFETTYKAKNNNIFSDTRIQQESPEFQADPQLAHAATRIIAQDKALQMFHDAVKQEGTDQAVLVTGADGSGHNLLMNGATPNEALLNHRGPMLETTLSDYGKLKTVIDAAVKAGRSVRVIHMVPTTLYSAALRHRQEALRGAPITSHSSFVMDHIQGMESSIKLALEYMEHPTVDIMFQTIRGGFPQDLTMDEVLEARYIKEGQTINEAFDKYASRVKGVFDHAERQVLQKREWALRGEESGGVGNQSGSQVPGEGEEVLGWTPQTPTIEQVERLHSATTDDAEVARRDKKRKRETGGLNQEVERQRILGRWAHRNGKSYIDIFSGANLHTVVHELFHEFHWEAENDYKALSSIPAEDRTVLQNNFIERMDLLAKEMGAPSFPDMTTEHKEKTARAFERYVAEGKAPSAKLRKAFHTFKVWMLAIYRSLAGINATINNNVRRIFDNMLALEEEVQDAKIEANPSGESIFRDINLPSKASLDLAETIEAARNAAIDELTESTVGEYVRDINRDARGVEQAIREVVSDELKSRKDYQTFFKLSEGEDSIKLNNEFLDKDLRSRLPKAIIAKKGGVDPETVAMNMGYGTDMEFINAMCDLKPFDEAVKLETAKRVEEVGVIKIAPSTELRDIAREKVRNEMQDKVYRKELEILASENLGALKKIIRKVTSIPRIQEEVYRQADAEVDALAAQDINAGMYIRDERAARAEAGKLLAKGDLQGAFEAVENARLAMAKYKAANRAAKEIASAKKLFRTVNRFTNKKGAKRRDADLVNAAKMVLQDFMVGRQSNKPKEYMAKVKEYNQELYDVTVDFIETNMPEPGHGAYELPMKEFRNLIQTVSGLWEKADDLLKIRVAGRTLHIDEVFDQFQEHIYIPEKKTETGPVIAKKKWQGVPGKMLSLKAELMKAEQLSRLLAKDGSDIFYKVLNLGISRASDQYRLDLPQSISKLTETLKQTDFYKKSAKKPIDAPELIFNMPGDSRHNRTKRFANKQELMELLLHTLGNESNKRKALVPFGWATINPDGSLNSKMYDDFFARITKDGTITVQDVEFLQAIGDQFQAILPKMQAAKKQIDGAYFDEIPPTPFEFGGKKFRGWYAPVVPDRTDLANQVLLKVPEETDAQGTVNLLNNHFNLMMPSKGLDGMTKGRTGYMGPIDMSFDLLPLALDKAFRYAYILPEVNNVCKVISDPRIKSMLLSFDESMGNDVFKRVLEPYLNAAVTQAIGTGHATVLGPLAQHLKTGATISIMTFSKLNILQQITGLATAVPSTRLWNVLKGSALTFEDILLNRTRQVTMAAINSLSRGRFNRHIHSVMFGGGLTREDIEAKSNRMKLLNDASYAEQADFIRDTLSQSNKFSSLLNFVRRNMYYGQAVMQNIVNQALWTAKYEESVEKGLDEEQAIIEADRLVGETQATPFPEDKAQIERGPTEWRASCMMFGGYWTNLTGYIITQTRLAARLPRAERAKRLSWLYGWTITATGMMAVAVRNLVKEGSLLGGDDDDPYLEWYHRYFDLFVNGSSEQLLGIIPAGWRQLIGFARYQIDTDDPRAKFMGDRIQVSPVLSTIERYVRSLKTDIKNEEDPLSAKFLRDAANMITLVTHIPTGPIAEAASDVAKIAGIEE